MKRTFMKFWFVPAMLLAVATAAAQEDAAKKGIEKLQGSWNVVAVEGGGSKAPQASLKGKRVMFKGSKISLSGKPDDLRPYRLDATSKPQSMDIGDEEKFSKAIYVLEGDTLKLCFSQSTKLDRPKNFDTAGTRYLCFTLKRKKP